MKATFSAEDYHGLLRKLETSSDITLCYEVFDAIKQSLSGREIAKLGIYPKPYDIEDYQPTSRDELFLAYISEAIMQTIEYGINKGISETDIVCLLLAPLFGLLIADFDSKEQRLMAIVSHVEGVN